MHAILAVSYGLCIFDISKDLLSISNPQLIGISHHIRVTQLKFFLVSFKFTKVSDNSEFAFYALQVRYGNYLRYSETAFSKFFWAFITFLINSENLFGFLVVFHAIDG